VSEEHEEKWWLAHAMHEVCANCGQRWGNHYSGGYCPPYGRNTTTFASVPPASLQVEDGL
jgi:hypothetical protein